MNKINTFLLFTLLLNQANMLNASCCSMKKAGVKIQEALRQVQEEAALEAQGEEYCKYQDPSILQALKNPRCTLFYAFKVTCVSLSLIPVLLLIKDDCKQQKLAEKKLYEKTFNSLRQDLSESDATTLIKFIHRTNDFTKTELFHQGNVAGFALCQQNENILTSSLSMYDKGQFIGCRKSPIKKAGPQQSRPRLSKFLYQMAPHPKKCFNKHFRNSGRKK